VSACAAWWAGGASSDSEDLDDAARSNAGLVVNLRRKDRSPAKAVPCNNGNAEQRKGGFNAQDAEEKTLAQGEAGGTDDYNGD